MNMFIVTNESNMVNDIKNVDVATLLTLFQY